MSRRTVIKSVKNTAENKSFSAKAIPYQVLDETAVITKALEDDKVAEKEKELLARELEKPYNQRNKALMNKYRGRVTEVLNGWPQDVSNGGYDITAVGVDDQDIPLELRPQPWYAKLDFNVHNNKYLIKFPLKKESSPDGRVIYKLDGYTTWIYPDGTIIDSMSDDENVYTALKRYVETGVVSPMLKKYLADPTNPGSPMSFKFPNFFVSYTQDRPSVDTEKQPHETKLQVVGFEYKNFPMSGSLAECERLGRISVKKGLDISPLTPINPDHCALKGIHVGKKRSINNWLLFTGIDADGDVEVLILGGAGAAAEALGRKTASIAEINKLIQAQNKEVLDKYHENKNKKTT